MRSEPLWSEATQSDMVALLTGHNSGKCFLAEVQDNDLIRSCQRGNISAFEELVRRHRGKAYAVAYGIVRNRDDALDITQEAFLRAYRSIGKFRRRAAFATWLRRIVVNLSIDHLRRTPLAVDRAKGPMPSDPAPAVPHPTWEQRQENGEDRALRRELGDAIDWAMRELPPQQRTAVILRDSEGLSYSEIARAMGCSKGTVMSRIHYGRQRLQTLLSSYLRSDSGE
jgi:RNA polymerase sigma-70 factor (ECF subfamily)